MDIHRHHNKTNMCKTFLNDFFTNNLQYGRTLECYFFYKIHTGWKFSSATFIIIEDLSFLMQIFHLEIAERYL